MGKSIFAAAGAIIGLSLVLSACGGTKKGDDPVSTTCTPDSKRCDGQSIKVCEASGKSESTVGTCMPNTFCRIDGDVGRCDKQACVPGQLLCDGSVATSCKADGTGPKPGGTDCDALSCVAGICMDVSCNGGEELCKNGDLYGCEEDGKTVTLVQDCNTVEVCDVDAGKCMPKVCNPSLPVCDGTVSTTCNASGSAWLPDSVDCAADELMCINGKCSAHICEPRQRSCEDGNVAECDATGEAWNLVQTCDPAAKQHCEETISFAYCTENVCVPGEELCSGNLLKTCNDDGSLPVEGEDCGPDAWCEKAECVPRSCTIDETFCRGADMLYCLKESPPKLLASCGVGLTCRLVPGAVDPNSGVQGALCMPLACTPGESTCVANKVGTCADDGESLSEATSDCKADSKVCTPEGTCAASATDVLGVDESVQPAYDGNFLGDVISVTSDRKVTQLGMWLDFHSARQLRWVIYEQSGNSFVAKVDKVATVATGGGVDAVTSPAFDFKLQAGKTYALGVVVSGGGATYSLDTAPFQHPSFGTLLGQVNTAYSPTVVSLEFFSGDGVVQMQVVTTLP